MQEAHDIDRIIARHLGGEATQAEQEALQTWLCESENNRAYFSALVGAPQPNIDRAWEKFAQHMDSPKHVKLWSLMLRYAAIAAVLIGLSIFMQKTIFDSPTLQVAAENIQKKAQEYMLQDSTSVHLSQNSKLTYVGAFGKGKREVKLEGEAFFDISSTGNGQFLVHAEETLIKDIGTSFNVQAYSTSDSVIVFVQSGEVQFFAKDNEGILVQASETGIYNKRTKTFILLKAGESNVAISSTKLFVFKNKPLSEAITLINKEYNAHITIDDSTAAKQAISATFDNEKIEEIVEIIGETMQLNVAQKDSIFLLRKK